MIIYGILYLLTFFALENRGVQKIYMVHSELDNLIPFCEYFVIPYFGWFILLLLWYILFSTVIVAITFLPSLITAKISARPLPILFSG